MDAYRTPESTRRRRASSRLKEYVAGATPVQKRLESVRKQTSLVPTSPPRRVPGRPRLPVGFCVPPRPSGTERGVRHTLQFLLLSRAVVFARSLREYSRGGTARGNSYLYHWRLLCHVFSAPVIRSVPTLCLLWPRHFWGGRRPPLCF